MSGRLAEQDWESIVKRGEPWKDPMFPYGKYCLFLNHNTPHKNTESKQKWTNEFVWKRASQYFGEGNYKVFDGIDPSDVIMGSINDCYAFAALSGLAEARMDEIGYDKDREGERIRDNFLT